MLKKSSALFPLGLLSLATLLGIAPLHADINGSDDFNDDTKDLTKWAIDRTSGGASLIETAGHLEYTAPATSWAYRPWALNQATYNTNWEVILDLANQAVPAANNSSVSMGIEVFAIGSNRNQSAYVGLYAHGNGGPSTARGFETGMFNNGNNRGPTEIATGSTSGSIRITFNAVTKVLAFWRDADGPQNGYSWIQQASYGTNGSGGANGNDSWNLTGANTMAVEIYGFTDGFAAAAGTVYADNFSASTGTSAVTGAQTNVTNTSATLNGTVSPGGLDTSVVFEWSTGEQFQQMQSTQPQVIPGSASTSPVSAIVSTLSPATRYFYRIKATNSLGTITGNTVGFFTAPYTLTVIPTTGTVTRTPDLPTYNTAATVTLTATPPAGLQFVSWTGDVTSTQNPVTVVMDTNKTVTANFSIPLATAIDAPGLTFTTGGDQPFWYGQGLTSHDGRHAARSGKIADNKSTYFQTTVTGPGTLSFWRKVSTDSADFFEFFIDGQRQIDYTGGIIDWTKMSYSLSSGTHTVRWQYRKDLFTDTAGEDAVWIDEITFTPPGQDFATWKSSKFTTGELADPTISGDNADPDGDGASNFLEFALGGQPKDAGSRILPVTQIETIDNEKYLTITVTKPADLLGVTHVPQVSGDLVTWQSGNTATTTITNTATTLKVRDNVPMSAGAKRFIRLKVTSN